MLIFVMRHGVAVDRDDPDYPDDFSRPLTKKGSKRTHDICRGLLELDTQVDAIFSSPYLRCRQTADIAVTELNYSGQPVVETRNLAPAAGHLGIIQEVVSSAAQSVLLVGHQPDLSELISHLIAGDSHALDIPLKKAAVALIEISSLPPTERGTLHFLLQPAVLRRLA